MNRKSAVTLLRFYVGGILRFGAPLFEESYGLFSSSRPDDLSDVGEGGQGRGLWMIANQPNLLKKHAEKPNV